MPNLNGIEPDNLMSVLWEEINMRPVAHKIEQAQIFLSK